MNHTLPIQLMWFFMYLFPLNLAWIRDKCDNKQAAICLGCCYANMNRNVIDGYEHLLLFSARFRWDCFDSSVRVPISYSKKRVDYLQILGVFQRLSQMYSACVCNLPIKTLICFWAICLYRYSDSISISRFCRNSPFSNIGSKSIGMLNSRGCILQAIE